MNIHIKELYKLYKELRIDIEFLLYCSVFYYNKYCAEASILKKRNKVYLLQKNIETTRSSSKLNHIKIKSFKIIRNIKEVSFKLKLLKDMQQKHLVFYILLLKPASDNILILKLVLNNYLMK